MADGSVTCDQCGKDRRQKLGAMTTERCLCGFGDLVDVFACPECGAECVATGELVFVCPSCDEVLVRN